MWCGQAVLQFFPLQQLEGAEYGVCSRRAGRWRGWGGKAEKLEGKPAFLSTAQRKKRTGLKGRNLRFAWDEGRQQSLLFLSRHSPPKRGGVPVAPQGPD